MNLFRLSPDTLYNLTCDVIDTLEYLIPESSFLSNNEVYAQLEETLGYSLVHIRNVFDFSTGTTLAKIHYKEKIYLPVVENISRKVRATDNACNGFLYTKSLKPNASRNSLNLQPHIL